MATVLDGVNHIAIVTRDMDRFIRCYQEAFEATVVPCNSSTMPAGAAPISASNAARPSTIARA